MKNESGVDKETKERRLEIMKRVTVRTMKIKKSAHKMRRKRRTSVPSEERHTEEEEQQSRFKLISHFSQLKLLRQFSNVKRKVQDF